MNWNLTKHIYFYNVYTYIIYTRIIIAQVTKYTNFIAHTKRFINTEMRFIKN